MIGKDEVIMVIVSKNSKRLERRLDVLIRALFDRPLRPTRKLIQILFDEDERRGLNPMGLFVLVVGVGEL